MSKTSIRVSRYDQANLPEGAACADGTFAWELSVEPACAPDEASWILFVPTKEAAARGVRPQLWHAIGQQARVEGGEVLYVQEGSAEHAAFLEESERARIAAAVTKAALG